MFWIFKIWWMTLFLWAPYKPAWLLKEIKLFWFSTRPNTQPPPPNLRLMILLFLLSCISYATNYLSPTVLDTFHSWKFFQFLHKSLFLMLHKIWNWNTNTAIKWPHILHYQIFCYIPNYWTFFWQGSTVSMTILSNYKDINKDNSINSIL